MFEEISRARNAEFNTRDNFLQDATQFISIRKKKLKLKNKKIRIERPSAFVCYCITTGAAFRFNVIRAETTKLPEPRWIILYASEKI